VVVGGDGEEERRVWSGNWDPRSVRSTGDIAGKFLE
jgi:hypothetical protein